MKYLILLCAVASVSGCALLQKSPTSPAPSEVQNEADSATVRPQPRPEQGTQPEVVELGASGQSADALDTTSDAERAEATVKTTSGAALGQTVASLGDPTEQGFWLKTPLVSSEAPGRVEVAAGVSVNVTLIPIDGPDTAGSRISLAAMRALGLKLTDLPTVSVFKS